MQYACFYDPDGYVTLAARANGTDVRHVERSQYRGNVADGHNVISMAVDVDGVRLLGIFRDADRGSRVSVACRRYGSDGWRVTDLTDFSVDAWESSIDKDLWRECSLLHIYVQHTSQGYREGVPETGAQPVYVLECNPEALPAP